MGPFLAPVEMLGADLILCLNFELSKADFCITDILCSLVSDADSKAFYRFLFILG